MADCACPGHRFHRHIADRQPVPAAAALEQANRRFVCPLPVCSSLPARESQRLLRPKAGFPTRRRLSHKLVSQTVAKHLPGNSIAFGAANVRHESPPSLTPDGERLFRRCERMLAELEDLQAEAAGTRAMPSGTIRIDMGIAYGRRVVMPLLARLLHEHPELQLDVRLQDGYVIWCATDWTWPYASERRRTRGWSRGASTGSS